MELPVHSLTSLFDQLGLPSDYDSIEAFIDSHSPLPNGVKVSEAPFWTQAQSTLLQDELQNNADWAPLVDALNERLHQSAGA